jgi:8-oxo-dGTP diphosphatase
VIEAAGGVVWRDGRDGAVEVLLVHRPRYDDWTLPKGKLEPGEAPEDAARREVEEETGLRCALGDELPAVQYVDHHGRPKRARYWAMRVVDGAFAANHEVDEVRWVPKDEVGGLLTHDHDATVVAALGRPGRR